MKYIITKHGQKLWHLKEGTVLSEEEIRVRVSDYFSIEGAIELGLLEEIQERIELRRTNLSPIAICKDGEYGALLKEFKDPEIKIMEHAINGEWGEIEECLEWVLKLYEEHQKDSNRGEFHFCNYLEMKINSLK